MRLDHGHGLGCVVMTVIWVFVLQADFWEFKAKRAFLEPGGGVRVHLDMYVPLRE